MKNVYKTIMEYTVMLTVILLTGSIDSIADAMFRAIGL